MSGPAFNSIGWFEIGTDQPGKVKEFYAELFGWQFELNTNLPGVRYHEVVTTPGQQSSGGVFESDGKFPDYAIFYVLVPDVAKTLQRAGELGAEVVMQPVTDAAGITFGRLRDSSGHHFGVFSPPAN
jgi:predicted enzyme related to lactoylglutathione lyase